MHGQKKERERERERMSLSKLWELVMDREGLARSSPWGHKELDMTEKLN